MIGVDATSKVRFWETELELDFHRNRSGVRKYTKEDIAVLKLISEAVKYMHLPTVKRLLWEGNGRLEEVVMMIENKRADASNV